MKKWLAVGLVVLLLVSLTACGGGNVKGNEIPDVFGIAYTDAVTVLEADGFEVSAIETSLEGINEKLLYPLEKVGKGIVFKVDDYILDNNGNLTKNYDTFYEGEFISEDKSVVIYYAKEDYEFKKESDNTDDEQQDIEEDGNVTVTTTTTTEVVTTTTTTEAEDDTGLDPEFKKAMDAYEEFMDDYVAFMKKYQDNPNDLTLLTDYAKFMSDYSKFVSDFEKWDDEDLNDAELDYYLEVQTRVNEKLYGVL